MHWLKHRKYRCGFLGRSAETLQKWLINTLQSVGIQQRSRSTSPTIRVPRFDSWFYPLTPGSHQSGPREAGVQMTVSLPPTWEIWVIFIIPSPSPAPSQPLKALEE